jgi:glycerol-3-phosphate dehydrogenase (NAD(P)+)
MARILVAGQGAWGQALAHVATVSGNSVAVWSRTVSDSPETAEAVILAVPAQAVREVLHHVGHCSDTFIIAAKGIERGTGLMMADVVRSVVSQPKIFVLSGPSFARDVMTGLPTAVTIAGPTLGEAAVWAKTLSLPTFRIYHTDDIIGVELGGALKNVLAIACGISDGRGLGDSARAALITRGFAELVRLASKLGARPETLTGLSGLGDLLLTCSSAQSRNYSFGKVLGSGTAPATALLQARGVVEGAATAAAAVQFAALHEVEMPITAAVHAIIDQGANPADMIAALLARPAPKEHETRG